MDINDNIEFLDESSVLPELSFDDLLDPSPAKKSNKQSFDEDDALEVDNKEKNHTDDTLNTPGPKKPPVIQKNVNTSIAVLSGSKMSTTIRKQAVKLGNSPNTLANVIKNSNGPTLTPVLLNNQNILPKTSAPTLNNAIKFTQKVVGGNGSSTNLSLAGKTAVRTSNGQIIYIQKSPVTSNIKTAAATTVVKTQALGNTNSKPVTIQVLRTADGSYHPLKTSTTTTANGKSTLTLSPTSLAGKKIISSTGGQLIIKGMIKSTDSTVTASSAKTITTNAITGVRTVVKPLTTSSPLVTSQSNDLNKSKPIVVQGTSGKQIIVSNQNIVKILPKPQTISTTAAGSNVTTSTTGSGQIHAIQIPGKIGVQYVRVLPNTKVPAKTAVNSSVSSSVTSTITSASTKTLSTINQPVKILSPLPQKFTVVQKGTTTKLMVTQKKDVSSNQNKPEFSPMTSKVQKTIVTVPTIKSVGDEKSKNLQAQLEQQSQNKATTQNSVLSNSSDTSQSSLARKHKITEINSEIQRITTATTTNDNTGPPEIKKPTPNNRVVVVSNNMQPKILNNSIQQPGRIMSSSAITPPTNNSNTNKNLIQTVNVTQNGNKLYTVLKPSSVEQNNNPKLYSVLKTKNPTSATLSATKTALAKGIVKPLINKQQLLQQQQKLLQLKQQNQQQNISQNIKFLNTQQTTTSSTYLLPIKIKEEPNDSIHSDNTTTTTTTTINPETTAAQLSLPTSIEEDVDALDNLVGGVRRKHCNCSKSQCLKLYCDCFANGEFCQDCTCKDCFNNLENEDERQRAIKACLERNPNAFKPKITSSRDQADMRLHNKGCNCKRSGCLKNYCECYEAKIPCSSNCKCVGCRNVEDRPDLDMDPIDPKIMATIAMGGGTADNLTIKRSYEKTQRDFGGSVQGMTIKTEKLSKEPIKALTSYDTFSGAISPTIDRQQCNFITQEVIDATIQCMITQADECEKNSLPAYQTEKMVMEELGRCLVEIIDFSIRNTDNSYSQE